MSKEPKRVQFAEFTLNPERLFAVVAADREPLLVEKEGVVFRIEIAELKEPEDIWADYDPQLAKAGLQKSAGALAGIDREELMTDIHEVRHQNSSGRP